MQITLAHIGSRARKGDEFDELTRMYLDRTSVFARCEPAAFRAEEALLEWMERQQGRTPVVPVLLDSRGKQMTSEAFAAWIGERREQGAQHLLFAVGPASGWTPSALERAALKLSLGHFTLAHALARLVLAEQIYRASSILTGHPYHTGH